MPSAWPDEAPPAWYVWWTLFEEQHGMCALCINPPHVIDHDHASGIIRGLLCGRCNRLEPFCCFPRYTASPPAGDRQWSYRSVRNSTQRHLASPAKRLVRP
ncbi:endonuclease domain-containing protein [Actinomadura oligospora]|uniref:endonuclease domain-containing protein n=1 Tax=Actinomadura oligospora TaxID=111804 RepID=UPI001B808817|nr:endonuclease domain-containing protein [Actinomadura oligospora]